MITLIYGLRADKPLYFNTSDLAQKFIDTENSEGYLPNIDYYNPKDGSGLFSILQNAKQRILWSPRAGFNWDITGDKTKQLQELFTGRLCLDWKSSRWFRSFFYQVVIQL
jgi:hypothetical protein